MSNLRAHALSEIATAARDVSRIVDADLPVSAHIELIENTAEQLFGAEVGVETRLNTTATAVIGARICVPFEMAGQRFTATFEWDADCSDVEINLSLSL